MNLLMHACCGPCATGIDISADFLFYNPYIYPKVEYDLRRESFLLFMSKKGYAYYLIDEYLAEDHLFDGDRLVRCENCYRIRLEKTAQVASEKGYTAFSTTLTISPYQDHELIRKTGKEVSDRYGVEFFYHDFRPNFYEAKKLAKEYELYRQKYCGCRFSLAERSKK